MWESDMGFDTGSSALQIFSFEILQLVRDFRVCSSNQCPLSDWGSAAQAFHVLIRVVSQGGKELLAFLEETTVCTVLG